MIGSRVGVSAMRQVAKSPNAVFFSQNLPRLAMGMQARPVSTTKLTATDAQDLLASQRRSRPVAPHLQIYDPAQTFFTSSIWTRITGSIFSGGLYVFGAAYLVAPLLGWHLESASIAAAFGALPVAAKGAFKFLLAWPFMGHCVNGIRHLVFDFAKGFSKSNIKTVGNVLWGTTLVSALGLAFLL
ncbi:histone H4-like TAF Taf6, SAGA complex subunit [Pestalotiopsis sp. IQ-011]